MNCLFGTGQVTLSDSDNDFVDPAPWSKSKEKRQDNTVETRNVKRKLVLKVNHLAKTKKKKEKNKGTHRLVDDVFESTFDYSICLA